MLPPQFGLSPPVPVVAAIPINATAGNVSVAFTALSSAGRLTVSIIVDPDLVSETGLLRTAMEGQLRGVVADEPTLVQEAMTHEAAAEARQVGCS